MSEFDETIKTKLQELTSQLTEKDRHMSRIQKNLDSSYQDELSKDQKKQRKELLIKEQEEARENQGNNFLIYP